MVALPLDGRLTSQNVLNIPLAGGEVMYIVSPGNVQFGNSYQVTTGVLAAFFAAFPLLSPSTITAGATVGAPYLVKTNDTRIFFNKTVGAASYLTFPLASTMAYPFEILVKDRKGDAGTNAITASFTGGQTCDGLTTIIINNPYGWFKIAPQADGSGWYQCG
jgi:hypothetical protein